MNRSSSYRIGLTTSDLRFTVVTCISLLLAHAAAYLTHEYSHSFTAWMLGWMADPLALDYGKHTLDNFLFLGDVGDNVKYEAIFASRHGVAAATIALAGTYVGNALLYFLLYLAAKASIVSSRRLLLSFVYWVSLMCAGNVWGYVPMRALTTHADIAIAARGLHLPSWGLFPFLIVPSLYVVYHFFIKMVPLAYPMLARDSTSILILLIALTSYWFFSFFGSDGLDGSYGLVSQLLSIASRMFLFPLCVLYLAASYLPSSGHSSSGGINLSAESLIETARM
jgi:hypothetical protein